MDRRKQNPVRMSLFISVAGLVVSVGQRDYDRSISTVVVLHADTFEVLSTVSYTTLYVVSETHNNVSIVNNVCNVVRFNLM